jgi:hypothetical protein
MEVRSLKDPLYIVMRRTTDWTTEATVRAQLADGFAQLVDLWNDTFDMPHHHFRHPLKKIAQANHARVEGAVTRYADAPQPFSVLFTA